MRATKQIASLGMLCAHALAIEYEAAARYREFAGHLADRGYDSLAELFGRLADFESERAVRLAKRSLCIEIPAVARENHAWLECGPPLPEARAFIFRMMTPRSALEIALRAKTQAKAFFERAHAESGNAGWRALAAELAGEEASHIACIADALARLPQPLAEVEGQAGDPTIEQQR